VQHFGASYVTVGILFATFAACQFIAGPLWGNLSDRIGRKSVLIISQIGATLGWGLLAFSPSLAWVFVARIVEGISGGNISVTQAYVADRIEPEQRSQAFAYVGAAFSAGFVLGPAAGGLLLSHYGYRTPFLIAALLQVVTLIVTIYFLPEKIAEKAKGEKAAGFRDIVRFLGDPVVSPVLVQKLAFSLGLYAWFAAFALVLKVLLGFGPSETSYFFAAFGLFSIVFQLAVVGRLTARVGVRRASNIGFFSACVFFVLVPVAHTITILFLTMAIFAFALSMTNATLPALITDASPERVRGTILGVGSSLDAIAGVIMPTISTAILTYYGTGWTGALSAFFCFVALVLGLIAQRRGVTTESRAA
jgi:DHA1 family tetracycline resistance protein-like MFS transporter